ncbi:MAG: ABC transporter permease [Candidatus Zipacnadales bacterium]
MIAILRVEITKFYCHRVTYLGFLLLLAMSALVVYGAARDAPNAERRLKEGLETTLGPDYVVSGRITTAVLVPHIILLAKLPVYVFVASLVAMAAGGTLANEYNTGTLRMLLCRPVRRTYVVLAKWFFNTFHALKLTMFLGASALGLGYIFLGGGDLVWMGFDGPFQVIPEDEAICKLTFAYLLHGFSMMSIASIALCVSCVVNRGAIAAGVTVGFLLLSGMVGVLPFESLEAVKPYLLTTHMSTFETVMARHVNWGRVLRESIWVGGYTLAGLLGAILIMGRREIKC